MPSIDVSIIGGGIVGLATARAFLAARPGMKIVVFEKEPRVGQHQTTHNSGVIHSGVYYRPGSLKAKTCVEGARMMVEFCQAHQIPYQLCGKLIVATTAEEVPLLETLYQRGVANGVPGLSLIGPEAIREREPHARGLSALHVPSAGIVDYGAVATAITQDLGDRGAEIWTGAQVRRLQRRGDRWVVETQAATVEARYLITCAGLQADRVAAMTNGSLPDVQIIPFRGEYYEVVPERRFLVRGMVYPVPNPSLPFLGVHFTRTIAGGLHAGPNAVLALKREGYRKRDVDLGDVLDLIRFRGFWVLARRYWRVGLGELYRSLNPSVFVSALQRLVPEIRSRDLIPAHAGVRAQAVNLDGALLDDFNIVQSDHAIHVRNVPSPAATASLRIGELIAEMAATAFAP